MSRIGKQPIELPDKVEVVIDNKNVTVKGPKGSLDCKISNNVEISQADKVLSLVVAKSCNANSPQVRAEYGTSRAIVANAVKGVTEGWEKKLEIQGVGFNAKLAGKTLTLKVGYSHDVVFEVPDTINCKIEKNVNINLDSIDKQLIGNFAAKIYKSCPPEPYLGKGIRYAGQQVRRKAGKTGAK